MFSHLLVPTDGSAVSRLAETAAIAFARSCGARLLVLSVAQPAPLLFAEQGAVLVDPGLDPMLLRQHAQDQVDRVALAAQAAGVPCRTLTVVSPLPADEIVEAARREGCDLIFMASHGRRGLARLFAGSQTRQVLLQATVPVLVWPAPGHATDP
jgi:nucleotide-binding universal stress UspA family protein